MNNKKNKTNPKEFFTAAEILKFLHYKWLCFTVVLIWFLIFRESESFFNLPIKEYPPGYKYNISDMTDSFRGVIYYSRHVLCISGMILSLKVASNINKLIERNV